MGSRAPSPLPSRCSSHPIRVSVLPSLGLLVALSSDQASSGRLSPPPSLRACLNDGLLNRKGAEKQTAAVNTFQSPGRPCRGPNILVIVSGTWLGWAWMG